MRGENANIIFFCPVENGPSPRAWGKLGSAKKIQGFNRSIPTCVGKILFLFLFSFYTPVHPHVRGENPVPLIQSSISFGPSPRAWGKFNVIICGAVVGRSIPTCVGKMNLLASFAAISSVHPHVRGENEYPPFPFLRPPGPSPRAWGKSDYFSKFLRRARSIPTCVGKIGICKKNTRF